jgi:hypothetical protein
MTDLKDDIEHKAGLKRRAAEKFLAPIVAAAASAAAGYAVKNGPDLFERRLLPWLRRVAAEAGEATNDLPARAKSVAEDAGDVAERLTERVRTVAGGAAHTGAPRKGLSTDELARRRQTRAKSRAGRRTSRSRQGG